jgi:hypothetical protein
LLHAWIVALTLGELVGFAIPSAAGAISLALDVPELALPLLLIPAGAGEGAALGFAEWVVLRRAFPGIAARTWTGLTAAVAALAWALALIPSTVSDAFDPSVWVLIAIWIPASPSFLLAIGGAQWIELRHHAAGAKRWIVINAIAWPVGVLMPIIALSLVPNDAPAVAWAVAGIAGGVAMGATVGAITGRTLVKLAGEAR